MTRFFVVAALALSAGACQEGTLSTAKHLRPVSTEIRALMAERGMDLNAPVLVRIFKAEGQLEVWKQRRDGRYALLRSFDICRWSGDLGPKIAEGDRQAPEGFYSVTPALMNPNSSYHLAFNTGYPNAFDRAHNRTGSHLMVHGDCSSRGCFAMTNAQMEEIFALARDAFAGGQQAIQLQILPFRMTAENMFRFRRNPNIEFWRSLKEGSDHFEATGRPPETRVCERRYVFNRTSDPDARFDPRGACPPANMSPEIRDLVAKRQRDDAARTAELERQYRNPVSAAAMLASLSGGSAASRPPHHTYATRQQILAALPSAAPEALSLLPGAESGATPELKQIARGERIGGPPVSAVASAAPTGPDAGPVVPATSLSLASAPSSNSGLVERLLAGNAAPQNPPTTQPPSRAANVPLPPPAPNRVAAAQGAPPAGETAGMWRRFLSAIGGGNSAPVAREAN